MSILTYENATVEELNMAVECLKRAGGSITDDRVREWFAQLNQASKGASSGTSFESQVKRDLKSDGKPKRRWHSWVPKEKRRRGRKKRIVAPWYGTVARIMADGTPLKRALKMTGVNLTPREIHNLYRLLEFKALYRAERMIYQMERQRRLDPEERQKMLAHFVRVFGGLNVEFFDQKSGISAKFRGPLART